MPDTIAAISTPLMQSSIGIIRISGDDAVIIAGKVFRCADKSKNLSALNGYTASYGHVFDESGDIDDGVALVFKSPHSYTGENVVELSLHGGPVVMKQALRAVLSAGARQAEAGEFTKRAFLNDKLSLTQAEAVMDVITAGSTSALQSANSVKSGAVYKKISELKEQLTFRAAQLAAFVDFPEEGLQEMDNSGFIDSLKYVENELSRLIKEFDAGSFIKNGIDCVIAGRPNVGKSTLMNLLSRSERSIVTSVAGTTRDIVEEAVDLDGILLRLSDTAGIHSGNDEVEKIGISKAIGRIENAQLVLAVFDAAQKFDENDLKILDRTKGIPTVLIVNKTDLGQYADIDKLSKYGDVVQISAATGDGIDELKSAILTSCGINSINPNDVCLANERQLSAAKAAQSALQTAIYDFENGQTLDAVGVVLDDAISALLELTGESVSESVVNEVFSKFCVGK